MRKNTGRKSAMKTTSAPHTSSTSTSKVKRPGIGKAAMKSPTPLYGTEYSSSSDDISDTTDSGGESSSPISMSEPSSHDEDELVTKLTHMDVKTGSNAPGPSPHAGKIVESLIKKAHEIGSRVGVEPPLYDAYMVNFFKSEYDYDLQGPVDTSEKPRVVRVRGGWRCPMFCAYEDAYKGCVLYDIPLPNNAILGLHMSRHHRDLEVHWRSVGANRIPQMFIYPRSTESEIECLTTYYDESAMGYDTLRTGLKTEPKPDPDLSATPETMQTDSIASSSLSPARTSVTLSTPAPSTPIKREPSPAPVHPEIVVSPVLPPPPVPRSAIKRERLTGIPLDPYIQPPYLTSPVPTEDGGLIYYSCRPGGPRIYDYLQVLSLKPYGLMRWQVEETEAHILESEGLSDVGKCMHSLHNRWALLHEVEMYVDPAKCIADFVHTWWHHIYNMVGIKVLTQYLTDFHHLKLISVSQAAKICAQYRLDVKAGTAEDGSLLPPDQVHQQDMQIDS
ncbi:unnamed protein product [Peniophora sp. CBMAI 1063]|nr:unnamed protein product [Peniophora sp. CBMAI 1063]